MGQGSPSAAAQTKAWEACLAPLYMPSLGLVACRNAAMLPFRSAIICSRILPIYELMESVWRAIGQALLLPQAFECNCSPWIPRQSQHSLLIEVISMRASRPLNDLSILGILGL